MSATMTSGFNRLAASTSSLPSSEVDPVVGHHHSCILAITAFEDQVLLSKVMRCQSEIAAFGRRCLSEHSREVADHLECDWV